MNGSSAASDRSGGEEQRVRELDELFSRGFARLERALDARLGHTVGALATKMEALHASVGVLESQVGTAERRLAALEDVPEVRATVQR